MNTIPFITEGLWSKMILLNLKLLTNIQWNYYYIWSIYNIVVQHIKFAETSHENYNFNRTASYIWILRDLRLGKCKIRNKREREGSNNVIVITTGLINSDSYCLKYMWEREGGRRSGVEQNAITTTGANIIYFNISSYSCNIRTKFQRTKMFFNKSFQNLN